MPKLSIGPRVRKSPYFDASLRHGDELWELESECTDIGSTLAIETPSGTINATVVPTPFVPAEKVIPRG